MRGRDFDVKGAALTVFHCIKGNDSVVTRTSQRNLHAKKQMCSFHIEIDVRVCGGSRRRTRRCARTRTSWRSRSSGRRRIKSCARLPAPPNYPLNTRLQLSTPDYVLKSQNPNARTLHPNPHAPDRKRQTLNPGPQPPNPNPQTLNPEP